MPPWRPVVRLDPVRVADDRAPPRFIVQIPLEGVAQALLEGDRGAVAELPLGLGAVDGAAASGMALHAISGSSISANAPSLMAASEISRKHMRMAS